MTASAIVTELTRRGQTVACAESLTGGLVAAALTAVPGASAVFTAGIVAYTPRAKTALAGVAAELIDTAGLVSGEVAWALALGARRHGGADWGIGTTGAAGPESHDGQPPGTVWIAVAEPTGDVRSRQLTLPGGRDDVRRDTVTAVLGMLSERLGLAGRENVAPAE